MFSKIFARFDRITAAQDAHAEALGLVVTRRGRWSSTYVDARAPWLAAARAGGCSHVPICPLTETAVPVCQTATAPLTIEYEWEAA